METGTAFVTEERLRWAPCFPIAVCCAIGTRSMRDDADRPRHRDRELQVEPKSSMAPRQSSDFLRRPSVSPLWVHIHSSTMEMRSELRARLLVRPPGKSMWNVFSARCSATPRGSCSVREAPADPHDPFWLAGTWLEIGVETERGNYAVSIARRHDRSRPSSPDRGEGFRPRPCREHDRPALKVQLILISLLDVHVMLENPGHRVCCTQ